MSNETSNQIVQEQESGRSVNSLVRGITKGSVTFNLLHMSDRRAIVEHLSLFESYTADDIADILNIDVRTVYRHREAIKETNALERDPEMVKQFVGRLIKTAEACITRTRRALREAGTKAAVKIDGERYIWQITDELGERLQSLGYLPDARHESKTDVERQLDKPIDLVAEFHRILPITQAHLPQRPELNLRITAAEQAINQLPIHQSSAENPPHEHDPSKRAA
jgi:DNA-binding CsgD family transcriptional regulator